MKSTLGVDEEEEEPFIRGRRSRKVAVSEAYVPEVDDGDDELLNNDGNSQVIRSLFIHANISNQQTNLDIDQSSRMVKARMLLQVQRRTLKKIFWTFVLFLQKAIPNTTHHSAAMN
ncbi:hypothetical protein BP5796_05368 [Coleophoma crateriformis]|uniref:Uncharacterized protein n=1 Tax=Coleophoma crateriformis TaxID=565419 RepID=A0A3D8S3C8_9HELO|nr:hypothetical protein BP5796_05368 [Coleophoma crateriformis]